jgi:hypothetical protein
MIDYQFGPQIYQRYCTAGSAIQTGKCPGMTLITWQIVLE